MKKIWIGLVIFISVAVGICIASAGYAKTYNYGNIAFSWGSRPVKLYNTQKFAADSIENLDIEYGSKNIDFYKGEEGEIVIKEYLRSSRKDEEAEMNITENTLYVKGDNRVNISIFSFSIGSERIEVYLPESYAGSVRATTRSGNIKTDSSWNFKEFEAAASSGNITCGEISADMIAASANSGNITFDKAQGERRMTATSGNIKIRGGEGNTSVETNSGNIEVEGAAGAFNASATSGNIDADFIRVENEMEAKTNSGNIRLTIPKESAFSYDANASSGKIRTDFDDFLSYNEKGNQANGVYGENAKAAIRTTTTSGNATISLR